MTESCCVSFSFYCICVNFGLSLSKSQQHITLKNNVQLIST